MLVGVTTELTPPRGKETPFPPMETPQRARVGEFSESLKGRPAPAAAMVSGAVRAHARGAPEFLQPLKDCPTLAAAIFSRAIRARAREGLPEFLESITRGAAGFSESTTRGSCCGSIWSASGVRTESSTWRGAPRPGAFVDHHKLQPLG